MHRIPNSYHLRFDAAVIRSRRGYITLPCGLMCDSGNDIVGFVALWCRHNINSQAVDYLFHVIDACDKFGRHSWPMLFPPFSHRPRCARYLAAEQLLHASVIGVLHIPNAPVPVKHYNGVRRIKLLHKCIKKSGESEDRSEVHPVTVDQVVLDAVVGSAGQAVSVHDVQRASRRTGGWLSQEPRRGASPLLMRPLPARRCCPPLPAELRPLGGGPAHPWPCSQPESGRCRHHAMHSLPTPHSAQLAEQCCSRVKESGMPVVDAPARTRVGARWVIKRETRHTTPQDILPLHHARPTCVSRTPNTSTIFDAACYRHWYVVSDPIPGRRRQVSPVLEGQAAFVAWL